MTTIYDHEQMFGKKYANMFLALFTIITLLSTQGVIRGAYGEASPVTCVVISNPAQSKSASNYIVTVNPPSAKVIPGSTTTFDVTVLSKDSVKDVVSLSVVGLPKGISADFDPAKGTNDFTSKLTISVDEMICPGIYTPIITAQGTNLQLADFKLEVASAGYVREAMGNKIAELENKIAALSSKTDGLESTATENQSNSFEAYMVVLLVAIIGSFMLGAFALFVLLRHSTKNSTLQTGTDVKLQEIIDLLKHFIGTSKKELDAGPAVKNESGQVTGKEQPVTEPKVGDVWYAYCQICGLRTEHGRDHEGIFCVRCGNRAS